jgi:hypothetical protein
LLYILFFFERLTPRCCTTFFTEAAMGSSCYTATPTGCPGISPAHAFQRWIDEAPDLIIDIEPVEPLALSVVNQLREQAVIPILLLGSDPTNKFILEASDSPRQVSGSCRGFFRPMYFFLLGNAYI